MTAVQRARSRLNYVLFQSRGAPLIQLAPSLILMLVMFAIPVLLIFIVSLWTYKAGSLASTTPTLTQYARFLGDPYYRTVALNTLQLGFTVSFISLLLGYPLAYILARSSIPGRNVFLFLLLTPLFVSVVVRSFGWIVLLQPKGVINWLLISTGLIQEPLKLVNNFVGTIIGLVNVQLTFMVMPIYSSLVGIPRSLQEAASTLGARPLTGWWRVILPLSMPGVVAGWLLVFSLSVSSYVQPSVLGGHAKPVMAVVLYSQLMNVLDWPFAAAIGFLLLVVALVCSMLPAWISRRFFQVNVEGGDSRE